MKCMHACKVRYSLHANPRYSCLDTCHDTQAGLYPAIVLLVIAIDAPRAAPSGTALGCESTITIPVTLPAAGTSIGLQQEFRVYSSL